jgi:hypothetical protein
LIELLDKIYEEDGLKELHNIETILLAVENSVIQLEDVYYEISIGDLYAKIPKEQLRRVFKLLDEKLKEYHTRITFTEV